MPALLSPTVSAISSAPSGKTGFCSASLSGSEISKPENLTALDYVRCSGILIASDGAEYNCIAEFDPLDATSNPSLVLAAVTKPEYAHLIDEAVEYAVRKHNEQSLGDEERVKLALLKLLVLVGVHILSIIPGRVSASVDPRVGSSILDILSQAHTLISLFEEHSISRSRVLIKVPGTPEGITAAHILEHPSSYPSTSQEEDPIHTNITLIFGRSQALACAQADLSVISPFVGRVKDWWDAQNLPYSNATAPHPGFALVSSIQRAYSRYGYKGHTQVMAAGFRNPGEVLAMAAGLGSPEEAAAILAPSSEVQGKAPQWKKGTFEAADLVTIPPKLLSGLRDWKLHPAISASPTSTVPRSVEAEVDEDTEPIYFVPPTSTAEGVKEVATTELYASTIRSTEQIVVDKVTEGLAKFSVDAEKLESMVRAKVLAALKK